MVERPEKRVLTGADLKAFYKALANPVRRDILSYLGKHGEANSTSVAKALGESTGTTSYHLRKLASVGLVEETEDGRGRERWWRASTSSHGWTERDVSGDPDAEAASDWLKRFYLRSFAERYEAWLDQAPRESLDWRDAADSGDTMLRVSPDRLRAFKKELYGLLDRYREASPDDADARAIAIYYHLFPLAPGDGGDAV